MRQVRLFLFTLAILFGIFLLLGQFYLSSWLGDTINNFRQQYIVLFALLAICALIFKDKLFVGLFVFLAFIFIGLNLSQISPKRIEKMPSKYTLTTYNVYMNNLHTSRIIDKLRNGNPDIIVLEEVTNKLYKTLRTTLRGYPYFAIDQSESSNHVVAISRYPFIQLIVPEKYEKIRNSEIVNVICQLPSGVVHLIGVHLSNPLIIGDFEIRTQEFKTLAEFIGENSDNLIVAGDFNTTPWSKYMVQFLKASHLHTYINNIFFQPTWMRKIPFITIPIDHVLFGKDFSVNHISVNPDSGGSDHHPLTVKFNVIN